MRRFESGTADPGRFWQVEVQGCWLISTVGEVGVDATTHRKLFPTPSAARRESTARVNAKLKAGWVEVDPLPADVSTSSEPAVRLRLEDKKKVLGWRPRPTRRKPLLSDVAWSRTLVAGRRQFVAAAKGLERTSPELLPFSTELVQLASGPPPLPLHADAQAALMALLPASELLDFWLSASDPAFVIRTLCRAGDWAWETPSYTTSSTWLTRSAGTDPVTDRNSTWIHLRRCLLGASDAIREGAEAEAERLRPELDIRTRAAMDVAFPWRPEWTDSDIEELVDTGVASPAFFSLLASTADPASAEALIRSGWTPQTPHRAAVPWMWTLLARCGLAATPAITEVLLRAPHADTVSLLSRIHSEEAARALVMALADCRIAASDALCEMPAFALPALRMVRSRPIRVAVRPLLQRLERQHPSLAGRAPPAEADPSSLPASLTEGPADTVPPEWIRPSNLPRPALASGEVLPARVVTAMTRWLPRCELLRRPKRIDAWLALCDRSSLAALGLATVDAWEEAGFPEQGQWSVFAAGHLADQHTTRELAARVVRWSRLGHQTPAIVGIDSLASVGTDSAMMQLLGVHQRVSSTEVRQRADLHVDSLAKQLRISKVALEERLVPDLGLNEDGRLALDLGSRKVTVSFDHRLTPSLTGAKGPLRSFPRPLPGEDPEPYRRAQEVWKALCSDAATLASTQIRRLETAMVERRVWERDVFVEHLVGHRLLRHLAQRLLWQVVDGPRFRVDGDQTFADIEDDALELPEGARIRVAHPVDLSASEISRWVVLFDDYELLQPFDQLGRKVSQADPDEQDSRRVLRLVNTEISVGRLMGLTNKGWQIERIGHPLAGSETNHATNWSRAIRAHRVSLTVSPLIDMSAVNPSETRSISDIRGDRHWSSADPVVFSEIIRDLVGHEETG